LLSGSLMIILHQIIKHLQPKGDSLDLLFIHLILFNLCHDWLALLIQLDGFIQHCHVILDELTDSCQAEILGAGLLEYAEY